MEWLYYMGCIAYLLFIITMRTPNLVRFYLSYSTVLFHFVCSTRLQQNSLVRVNVRKKPYKHY